VNKEFLSRLKSQASSIRVNYKGRRFKKKYLIIESDDWGAIRTPSKESLIEYSQKNIDLTNSVYKNDCLENQEDFEKLFYVLNSIKDLNGNPAKLTANTIVANPDFKKIEENNFEKYFFEPFIETYKKSHCTDSAIEVFKEGINKGLIYPQFHGREHLNISRWLKDLQNRNNETYFSFKLNSTFSGVGDYSYMEAFDWDSQSEIENHKLIISEGLSMFESIFGFNSKTFIPPCYNLDPKLNDFLVKHGVRILQGMRVQLAPNGSLNKHIKIPHYFFEKDKSGLLFNIRNVYFEPVFDKNLDWVDNCLREIQIAFLFNKPAVISSHRINYVSSISKENGEFGLIMLQKLLKSVIKQWPDIQFISTPELLNINE
jgi:hypothetical protein